MALSSENLTNDSTKEKKAIPKWVPVALLAVTTAALAVPLVLLRRQRTNLLTETLEHAPPPPRRSTLPRPAITPTPTSNSSSLSSAPPPRRSTFRRGGVPLAGPSSNTSTQEVLYLKNPALSSSSLPPAEEDFNGALYSAKAFGIATLFVTVGAVTAVMGIKAAMGVRDTQEFADRMRSALLRKLPSLSARIYRPPDATDHPEDGPPLAPIAQGNNVEWNWSAAEDRLRNAFDKDGFSGWAEAAMRELEAEGALERSKRQGTA